MPVVASGSVFSRLLRLRVWALDESKIGVVFLSSEREDGVAGVDRDKWLSLRDATAFDRVR